MESQERHYNIHTLNLIFALSSLVLLGSLLWLFWDDYARPWKDQQRNFRNLEIEKARVKHDLISRQLEQNKEYKELSIELQEARQNYKGNCGQLTDTQKEIENFQAQQAILEQRYKFTKAEMDAAKYRYETALAHGTGHIQQAKEELDQLDAQENQLKREVDKTVQIVQEKSQIVENCGQNLKELEQKERQLTAQRQILERKLAKIDPNEMGVANQAADIIRDLPVIDLANPSIKVEQVVLKDITDDVNFLRVPKVERCTTCHMGMTNPDYQNAQQPFKTHPHLEIFLSSNSAHPLEDFGCTVCHGGRGRGTDFISAVHTPRDEIQAKEWEEKYDWHTLHHWQEPMLPMAYVEASCFKCHSGQTVIKNAERLNLGLNLIEKAGCYNCHLIEKYKDWPKSGPDLIHLSSKVNKDWAYRWIWDPRSFRHNTWMPSFFGQSNSSDSLKREEQEIHSIVHYLFAESQDYTLDPVLSQGDPDQGEQIVASIGCLACHQIQPQVTGEIRTRDLLRKEHGPNLTGLGTKTSQEWLYHWLKDPQRYHPQTRMPNLRLTDQEAADIAAFLSQNTQEQFDQKSIPPVDEQVINDIVLSFLMKSETAQAVEEKISVMNLNEKLHFAGEKLIAHYGCYGCHNIKGFENTKPVGTELSEEGSKPVDKLDFGFIHIDHTNYSWFTQKLKDPRIFDQGKVKSQDEKLKMPNFHFSDEEITAIVTAILGFVKDKPPESKIVPRTPENISMEEGQKIVRQLNCQGCHIMEQEGGTIQGSIKDWLIKYENKSEAEAQALITSFSPPNLMGEGKKVHAQWLFEFLHGPQTLRPWLKIKMPTFNFNTPHLNALVYYFNTLDQEPFPFTDIVDTALTPEEYIAAEKLFSGEYFDCAKCHIVGDKMPSGSADSWAPDFLLAKMRLKPDWIIEWLKDPQKLLPGTKMPTFFDSANFDVSGPEDILSGDENQQIRVLRNYLITLSEKFSVNSKPMSQEMTLEQPVSSPEEKDTTLPLEQGQTQETPPPAESVSP